LKPVSERSFLDNCREPIKNLPRNLVKQSKLKGINGREREEKLAKEELNIRILCIKALIDGDETGEAKKSVAQDDLGMITKKNNARIRYWSHDSSFWYYAHCI